MTDPPPRVATPGALRRSAATRSAATRSAATRSDPGSGDVTQIRDALLAPTEVFADGGWQDDVGLEEQAQVWPTEILLPPPDVPRRRPVRIWLAILIVGIVAIGWGLLRIL